MPALLYRVSLEADRYNPHPARWPAVVLLAICFLLVAAVALGWLRWVRGRWLVVLGAMTYPLYLLHLDLGGTVIYLWQRRVPAPLLVALVTAAMVLLAWLVHRYVERPVAPLLRRGLLGMSAVIRQRSLPRRRVDAGAQPAGQPSVTRIAPDEVTSSAS